MKHAAVRSVTNQTIFGQNPLAIVERSQVPQLSGRTVDGFDPHRLTRRGVNKPRAFGLNEAPLPGELFIERAQINAIALVRLPRPLGHLGAPLEREPSLRFSENRRGSKAIEYDQYESRSIYALE